MTLTNEQIEAHREVFARFLHDRVTELHVSAEERVAICDMALRLQSLEQELGRARKDAERWKYGCEHGFPEKMVPRTTATVSLGWYYRQSYFDSANDAIDTARRTSGDERG